MASLIAIGSVPDSRNCDTNTRLPSDLDIFSPSSLTIPACAYRRANTSPPAPNAALACAALISWCGKIRSEPPACTSNARPRYLVAIAAHSTCQPGRPWPNLESQDGSPGRLASQTTASSGSFLPGRPGSPPRSADSLIIVSVSSPETDPNAGSADRQKYTSPSMS